MAYLFTEKEITLNLVKGAYKKFKSKIFYDKTLLYIKKKIAEFESNREYFGAGLNSIADALTNLDVEFFERLISRINFKILPKRFESNRNADVVYGSIDHNQSLSNINFFIDMPIELHIVDFLWAVLIGKIMNSYKRDYFFAAATQFKKGLFKKDESLIEGIDFDSNRAFKPYFELYCKWRNGAFNTIESRIKNSNLLLICLDLKSFYYYVDFNFDNLRDYLHNDARLDAVEFLTDIIKKIYSAYTKLLMNFKKGIRVSQDSCIFPIGVDSASVLREVYLVNFDRSIVDALHPYYYQRYVDDMLIVLNDVNDKETINETILVNNFVSTGLATLNGDDLQFKNYSSLRIQKGKVNCFYFHKGQKAVLIDIYKEVIKKNSSEANLLPDMSILNTSFTSSAYNIENLDISDKLRDLRFIASNNYKATRYISDFQRLVKNTVIDEGRLCNFFNQVEDFYQGSQCIEYSNNWRVLFELYFLCDAQPRGRQYYIKCKDLIKNITFDSLDENEILKKKSKLLLKKLKADLREKLDIAISLAGALNYKSLKSNKLIELAKQFRAVNLLNHKMISYPLLDYMKDENVPLTEIDMSKIVREDNPSFDLDRFKLEWSPRFIHTVEFFIIDFLHNYYKGTILRDPNEILTRFFKYNNLNYGEHRKINFISKDGNVKLFYLNVLKDEVKEHKIAVVNTKISDFSVLDYLNDPYKAVTLDAKLSVYKVLNTVKDGYAEFVVFPEFYLPLAWILDLANFSIKNNITIITGLQYITFGKVAFNNLCTISPYKYGKRFNVGLVQFREKNFYAPKEKLFLSKKGFKCNDKEIPLYYIISSNGYSYSSILCYEFTDISSRASMKSNIELLFVPQLNHDTNYFSAIVESAARDLHCFVIQSNTSEYGDSRITAPYNTLERNILQVKGGETDVVMVGKVEINKLIAYRQKYENDLKREMEMCFKCGSVKKHSAVEYDKICRDCKKLKHNESKIKPLPPKFT